VLPFWIADMEFHAPDFIMDALQTRLDHGVFGYTGTPAGLSEAVVEWSRDYCGYAPDPQTLVWLPGVVAGLNVAARTFARPDGAIGTTTARHWVMDFDAMARQFDNQPISAFLLCNPQNPTGRVYSKTELSELAEFCLRRNIKIISDEIHCPLVIDPDHSHYSIAGLAPEVARNTITLQAPSKAWNLAGASSSVAIIEDPELRETFCNARAGLVSNITPFAYAAAQAAYAAHAAGNTYLQELCAYLRTNHDALQSALEQVAPNLSTPVEATCLAWIDVRDFPAINSDAAIGSCGAYFESHGLGLSDGVDFGGPGFVRFNFGAPKALVERGIERLIQALVRAQPQDYS